MEHCSYRIIVAYCLYFAIYGILPLHIPYKVIHGVDNDVISILQYSDGGDSNHARLSFCRLIARK